MTPADRAADGPPSLPRDDWAAVGEAAAKPATPAIPWYRSWLRPLGFVVTVGALLALALAVQSQWSRVAEQLAQARLSWLVLSLIPLLASHLVAPAIWRGILRQLGVSLTWKRAYVLIYAAQLAKYLPGGIWSYVSLLYWARVAAIEPRHTLTGAFGLTGLISSASALVFAVTLAAGQLGTTAALLVAGLGLVLGEVALRVGGSAIARLGTRLGRSRLGSFALGHEVAPNHVKPSPLDDLAALLTERRTPLRGYFGYALLYWLLVGVGYYCVLAAFDPTVEVRTAVLVTGFYAGAWLAGYYTLLSPGGLGIRELTYAALLLTVLPSSLAAMLPLVARLWTLVGELISGLIAIAMLRSLRTE